MKCVTLWHENQMLGTKTEEKNEDMYFARWHGGAQMNVCVWQVELKSVHCANNESHFQVSVLQTQ